MFSLFHPPTVTELYVLSRITMCLFSIRHTIQTKPDFPTILIRRKPHNVHVYMCHF